MGKRIGKQTIEFERPPRILMSAAIGGKKEGEGQIASYLDAVIEDPFYGEDSWEMAETSFQYNTVQTLLKKAKVTPSGVDLMYGGDLINQCTNTYFAARDLSIPIYGLYGACSTMAESLQLASIAIDGGGADKVIAVTSSHFCAAEKQFRFPLDYGGQRPPTAQWTVTGSGAVLLGNENSPGGKQKITHITTGKIVDMGITDANNMGAAMAPSAADTIQAHFRDTGFGPQDYDLIVTGDLGMLGKTLIHQLLLQQGIEIKDVYDDCGCMVYHNEEQDMHCGASGCGCSAITLCGKLLKQMDEKKINRLLFIATGALMSTVTCQQGESIAGIAHAVRIVNE